MSLSTTTSQCAQDSRICQGNPDGLSSGYFDNPKQHQCGSKVLKDVTSMPPNQQRLQQWLITQEDSLAMLRTAQAQLRHLHFLCQVKETQSARKEKEKGR
jgi:hypothetical protein